MRNRIVRAGGMGEDRIKEDTKVLEYPIVIIIVGAFIESPLWCPSSCAMMRFVSMFVKDM